MTFPSYHLWLKPSGTTYDALSEMIEKLAHTLGGPVFAPHVTLLGSLAGTEEQHHRRTEALAARMQPFEIILEEPCTGTKYFESIFMRVRRTPPVMSANMLAAELFDRADAYGPHLSMAYGDFADSCKQQVIPRLTAFAGRSFRVDHVYLIRADSLEPKDWHEISNPAMSALTEAP